jgi:carbonic anhydrase
MKTYQKLLLENKSWAREMRENDPDYFRRTSGGQDPAFLWIGCSDSRVATNVITNTEPGEMFVQRNIANLVLHTDLNLLSVLQYAVHALHIRHIIVCGHYGCGGVRAAMDNTSRAILNKWLRPVKEIYRLYANELDAIADESKRVDRLVELNVLEQVYNVAKTGIVQSAWRATGFPFLHGWVYDLNSGELKTVIDTGPEILESFPKVFRFEDA